MQSATNRTQFHSTQEAHLVPVVGRVSSYKCCVETVESPPSRAATLFRQPFPTRYSHPPPTVVMHECQRAWRVPAVPAGRADNNKSGPAYMVRDKVVRGYLCPIPKASAAKVRSK